MLNTGLFKRLNVDYTTAIGDITALNDRRGYIKDVMGKASPPHLENGIPIYELTWSRTNKDIIVRFGEDGTLKPDDLEYILVTMNYNSFGMMLKWDDNISGYYLKNDFYFSNVNYHYSRVFFKIVLLPHLMIDLDFRKADIGRRKSPIIV